MVDGIQWNKHKKIHWWDLANHTISKLLKIHKIGMTIEAFLEEIAEVESCSGKVACQNMKIQDSDFFRISLVYGSDLTDKR